MASPLADSPHLTFLDPERSQQSRSTAACGSRRRHARRADASLRVLAVRSDSMAKLELVDPVAPIQDEPRSPAAERLDRLDEMLSRYLGPTVIRAMADGD